MTHALASNLRGFPTSTLRVRVERIDERASVAWVRTADLADVGTPLVLDLAQLADLDEVEAAMNRAEVFRHRDGLVELGGAL